MKVLSQPEWSTQKREPLQTYRDYSNVLGNAIKFIPLLKTSMDSSDIPFSRKMLASHSRAEQTLNLIIYSYSAGAPVREIAEILSGSVCAWQDFATHNLSFEKSNENDGHKVPHIDLYDTGYWSLYNSSVSRSSSTTPPNSTTSWTCSSMKMTIRMLCWKPW